MLRYEASEGDALRKGLDSKTGFNHFLQFNPQILPIVRMTRKRATGLG
jgi:hypothetical protein